MPLSEYEEFAIEQAWSAHHARDWPEAALRWSRVRDIMPGQPLGYARGAAALRAAGDLEAAGALLSLGLARHPDDHELLEAHADIASRQGRWAIAAERWHLLRRRRPDYGVAYRREAQALVRSKRATEADALLKDAMGRFPDDAALLGEYAAQASRARRPDEALSHWRRAHGLAPNVSWIGAGFAEALRATGDTERAADLVDRLMVRHPDDVAINIAFARIAEDRRDWDGVVGGWRSASGKFGRHSAVVAALTEAVDRTAVTDPPTSDILARLAADPKDAYILPKAFPSEARTRSVRYLHPRLKPTEEVHSVAELVAPRASDRYYRVSAECTVSCPPVSQIDDPFGRGIYAYLAKNRDVTINELCIFALPHCDLFGSRLLASRDGDLLSDFPLEAQNLRHLLAGTGDLKPEWHRLSEGDRGYTTPALDGATFHVPGVSILLTSAEPHNYGAWLIRTLPKLFLLRRLGLLDGATIICPVAFKWQKDILRWAGVPLSAIVNQDFMVAYRCDHLIVPQWPSRNKYLDETVARFIDEALDMSTASPAPSPQHLYVSRNKWNKERDAQLALRPHQQRLRAFDQEEELVARLNELGVTCISPEDHTFDETVQIFSRARSVIGPQGSGLFNAIFCSPGTKVAEIAHLPYFANGHTNMFLSRSLDYNLIVGADDELGRPDAHPVHRALRIDVESTVRFCKDVVLA